MENNKKQNHCFIRRKSIYAMTIAYKKEKKKGVYIKKIAASIRLT